MTKSTALGHADHFGGIGHERSSSISTKVSDAIRGAMSRLRCRRGERIMIAQLAQLDNALLLDVGLSWDEIRLLRRGKKFTPAVMRGGDQF